MRLMFLSCIIAATICATGSSTSAVSPFPTSQTKEDSSLLKPTDIAHSEAMEFSTLLHKHGLPVNSVHRSTMEGFFRGMGKAAFFRTTKGVVEVIFFPDPEAAKRMEVTERRDGLRYIYSFRGQPNPNPPGDTIHAAYPKYFVVHKRYFIITSDRQIAEALSRLFAEPY